MYIFTLIAYTLHILNHTGMVDIIIRGRVPLNFTSVMVPVSQVHASPHEPERIVSIS